MITIYRFSCSGCQIVLINNEIETEYSVKFRCFKEIRLNYLRKVRQYFSHDAKLPKNEHFPILFVGTHPEWLTNSLECALPSLQKLEHRDLSINWTFYRIRGMIRQKLTYPLYQSYLSYRHIKIKNKIFIFTNFCIIQIQSWYSYYKKVWRKIIYLFRFWD